MSQNTQILTMIGQLGVIPPQNSQVVFVNLRDQAGNVLDITDVSVDWGLEYIINNVTVPRSVVFINQTDLTATNARYRIAHDHSIQTQYPTPAGTLSAIAPPNANTAKGVGEWYTEDAQVIPAAGPADPTVGLVELDESIVAGSLASVLSLAGLDVLRFDPVVIPRVFKFEAKINVSLVAAGVVTLQLVRDPSGAGTGTTVVAESQFRLGAGEVGELTLQALVPVTAAQVDENDRQYALRVSSPLAAGDITVGLAAARGVSVIVSSIV